MYNAKYPIFPSQFSDIYSSQSHSSREKDVSISQYWMFVSKLY